MAGYLVTKNSLFTPFSYEEMVKPVAYLNEMHNAAADEYDKLTMDTQALGNYIDKEKDPEARKLYDAYMQRLQALQDNLWSKGYNAGTRRDLAAARAGYGDVSRIMKAVEDRQTRSKEYWDMVHKNPDTVAGIDPGTIGLDVYMKNDSAGLNWFSYSGNQLEKDVAAEAKNRAQGYFKSMVDQAGADGYQRVLETAGFTNDDVDYGIALAERILEGGAVTDSDSLKSQIVAQAILRGMETTGADSGDNGNVSPEGFRRLFEFASRGAAAGILGYNEQFLKNPAVRAGAGGDGAPAGSYGVNAPMLPFTNKEAVDALESVHDNVVKPFEGGALNVITPTGMESVDTVERMTELMRESDYSRNLRGMFDGVDVNYLLDDGDASQKFVIGSRELTARKMSRKEASDLGLDRKKESIGIYYTDDKGREILVPEVTRTVNNNYVYKHLDYVSQMKELNRDNNLDRIEKATMSGKKKRDFYSDNGLDARLPLSDARYAIAAKNTFSHQKPAALVTPGAGMENTTSALALTMFTNMTAGEARSFDKKKSKTGELMLYPVSPGGKDFEDEGVDGVALMKGSNGNLSSAAANSTVIAYPEDIARGKLRIIIPGKGEYGFDARLLDDEVYNALYGSGFQSAVADVMSMFSNADKVLLGSKEETDRLTDYIYSLFMEDPNGDGSYPYVKYAPFGMSKDGKPARLSAKQILRNQEARDKLYSGIRALIDERFAKVRDVLEYYSMKKSSGTSKVPMEYDDYL